MVGRARTWVNDAAPYLEAATLNAMEDERAAAQTKADDAFTLATGKAATIHQHVTSDVTNFNTSVDARIQNIIGSAPATLDTLQELATAMGNDPNFAASIATALANRSVIGHTHTKAEVGLPNVDNTSDIAKPVSTATQNALNLKAASAHVHPVADITATGTKDNTTYLRGDGTWAVPAGSGGGSGTVTSVSAANGTITVGGTAAAPTVAVGTIAQNQVTNLTSDLGNKAALAHTHTSSQITDLLTVVDSRIQNIVAAAPAALDTLDEIAAALNDDPNFAATITGLLAGKAALSHTHSVGDLTATGTKNNTTFLRGDNTWSAPAEYVPAEHILVYNGTAWPASRPSNWGATDFCIWVTTQNLGVFPASWSRTGDEWHPHPDEPE